MRTKKIKEELDRELDEATPNLNINKVKEHKMTLIDDYTIATHRKMDKLRYITAGALFLVFALACFLIITNVVKFSKPQKTTEVTCYIVTGLMPKERVHIVTKNGVVVERFSIGGFADKYMEYDENGINLKNYKGVPTAEYLHNLLLVMTESKQPEVTVKLQAINNSYEKTKQELKSVNEEMIRLNVGDQRKINLDTEPIQHSAYNDIIKLKTFISDLDSQLEIILVNDVKPDIEE